MKNNIRELLIKNNMTEKELVSKLKMTEASVSRYITGARIPKVTTAIQIATILNCSVEDLYSENCDDNKDISKFEKRITSNIKDGLLFELLGVDNMERLKSQITDIIIEQVKSDLQDNPNFILTPYEIVEDILVEAKEEVRNKLKRQFKKTMLDYATKCVDDFNKSTFTCIREELITKWKAIYKENDICMRHLLASEEANELTEQEKYILYKWAGEVQ